MALRGEIMPLFGPPDIEKLKTKQDINGLIKALSYRKDYLIRINAARALGKIGDERAIESLAQELKNEDPHFRKAVAEALKLIWVNRLFTSWLNPETLELLSSADPEKIESLYQNIIKPLMEVQQKEQDQETKKAMDELVTMISGTRLNIYAKVAKKVKRES
jgi:HEAT repeat protein